MKKHTKKHTNICVLETRWWTGRNTSLRPIFELISDIHCGDHHSFEYEMINNIGGFSETFSRQINNALVNYLVIAAHGDEQNIYLYNNQSISRTLIRNKLKKDDNRQLVGLHFGSCSFLNENLARFLYGKDISPWWISGYGGKVDWIDASAFEFFFFNKILKMDLNQNHPTENIDNVCKQLWEQCPGLIKKLKFQVYSLDKKDDLYCMFPYT